MLAGGVLVVIGDKRMLCALVVKVVVRVVVWVIKVQEVLAVGVRVTLRTAHVLSYRAESTCK